MSYLAAIEVDQRQRIVTATDKLKEMLGGSWQIAETVTRVLGQLGSGAGTSRMVAPVSGAVWLRAESLEDLWEVLWRARVEVTEDLDLPATFAIVEYSEFDAGKRELEGRVRELKDAKGGEDGAVALPLMAMCQLDPTRGANHWAPGRTSEAMTRRRLVSSTQEERRRRGQKTLTEYLRRFPSFLANWTEPEQFKDLAQGEGDQYFALVKADGDGMSTLVSTLQWKELAERLAWRPEERNWVRGKAGWPEGDVSERPTPEQAFTWFSLTVEAVLWEALEKAVEAVMGGEVGDGRPYPIVPLVRAGEDTAILCRRDLALRLAVEFGKAYEELANAEGGILRKAVEAAGLHGLRLSMSMGVLYLKQGYPFEMIWELTEELQGNAKRRRLERGAQTGYIDLEWFASAGREGIGERRDAERYDVDGQRYEVRTRPWSVADTEAYGEAARKLEGLPQKRWAEVEQVVRLGGALGDLAWQRWLTHLSNEDLKKVSTVLEGLPERAAKVLETPWSVRDGVKVTALEELGLLLKTWRGMA